MAVEYSPNQLDRIEQKIDRLLKRFVDTDTLPTGMTEVRVGTHELTPNDDELRRRIAARA